MNTWESYITSNKSTHVLDPLREHTGRTHSEDTLGRRRPTEIRIWGLPEVHNLNSTVCFCYFFCLN